MKASRSIHCLLVCCAAACGGSGDEAVDTLPKRGEMPTDPTILDVEIFADSDERVIAISASDPGGVGNLASCQTTVDGVERVGTFTTTGLCPTMGPSPTEWQIGSSYVFEVLVSNGTGGFTTANVRAEVVMFQ